MQSKDFIQTDEVEDLKRSRRAVGELSPAIKDQHGRTISGAHRLKAGWKKVVVVNVKDDGEFHRLRIHYNIQRQLPPNEWTFMFDEYAKYLASLGWKDSEIMKELLKVSPFGVQHTYETIPDCYKSNEGRPRKMSLASGETLSEGSTDVVDGAEFGVKGPGEQTRPRHPIGPCPCCRPPKQITYIGGRFEPADAIG